MSNDGYVDLIITMKNGSNKIVVIIVSWVAGAFDTTKSSSINTVYSGQPVMFQKFNSQRQLLQGYLLVQASEKQRLVFTMSDKGTLDSQDFSNFMQSGTDSRCQNLTSTDDKILSNDKGSSVIDFNGDCKPDLVLETVGGTTSYLEFYITTDTGFCLIEQKSIPGDTLMASFGDISRYYSKYQTKTEQTI